MIYKYNPVHIEFSNIIFQHRFKMHDKGMHLLVVGKNTLPKEKKNSHFEHKKIINQFKDQEVPKQMHQTSMTKFKIVQQIQKANFKAKFLINEDPRKSRFCHGKLMGVEKLSAILTVLILFLQSTKTEIDIYFGSPSSQDGVYLMNCISMCIGALIMIIFLRHICLFELEAIQNKVYISTNKRQSTIISFLKQSSKLKQFLLEVLIILPHPISYLRGQTISIFQTYDQIYINHSINDLLSLLSLLKVYIIIRSLLNISQYSSPRSSRLCYQSGFEYGHLYAIKCILNQYPLQVIAINFGIFMMICGYSLKLCEGMLFIYNPGEVTGFQNYSNCFWCIFITMATVGYGDLFPKTLPGRCIIIFTAILGVLLSSLLIVSLTYYLDMEPSETKSFVILNRLVERQELLREASKSVASIVKIRNYFDKQQKEGHKQISQDFQLLKQQVQDIKNRSCRIKSLVDSDNITEEMSRLFYMLKSQLRDIFNGQVRLKQEMTKIASIQTIKLSFIKEMSQMFGKPSKGKQARNATQTEMSEQSETHRQL